MECVCQWRVKGGRKRVEISVIPQRVWGEAPKRWSFNQETGVQTALRKHFRNKLAINGNTDRVFGVHVQWEASDITFTPGCKMVNPAKPAGDSSHLMVCLALLLSLGLSLYYNSWCGPLPERLYFHSFIIHYINLDVDEAIRDYWMTLHLLILGTKHQQNTEIQVLPVPPFGLLAVSSKGLWGNITNCSIPMAYLQSRLSAWLWQWAGFSPLDKTQLKLNMHRNKIYEYVRNNLKVNGLAHGLIFW